MEYDHPKSDFVEEAKRIIKAAEQRSIVLRVMGAVAYRIHCQKYLSLYNSLGRELSDIDFVGYGKQKRDIAHSNKIIGYLEAFMLVKENQQLSETLKISKRLSKCKKDLKRVSSENYIDLLEGTIGLDPIYGMEE